MQIQNELEENKNKVEKHVYGYMGEKVQQKWLKLLGRMRSLPSASSNHASSSMKKKKKKNAGHAYYNSKSYIIIVRRKDKESTDEEDADDDDDEKLWSLACPFQRRTHPSAYYYFQESFHIYLYDCTIVVKYGQSLSHPLLLHKHHQDEGVSQSLNAHLMYCISLGRFLIRVHHALTHRTFL